MNDIEDDMKMEVSVVISDLEGLLMNNNFYLDEYNTKLNIRDFYSLSEIDRTLY